MTWQPISSAPKNVPVLIWFVTKDEDGIEYNVWPAICTSDDFDVWEKDKSDWWSIPCADGDGRPVGFSTERIEPLFWMPMPNAPE